jgi:hypothetical protein
LNQGFCKAASHGLWWLGHVASNIEVVQDLATQWASLNNDRLNMAWGGFTPKMRLTMTG